MTLSQKSAFGQDGSGMFTSCSAEGSWEAIRDNRPNRLVANAAGGSRRAGSDLHQWPGLRRVDPARAFEGGRNPEQR